MKIKDDFWEWGQGSQMLWRNQGHAGAGNNQGLVPRAMLRDTRCQRSCVNKGDQGRGHQRNQLFPVGCPQGRKVRGHRRGCIMTLNLRQEADPAHWRRYRVCERKACTLRTSGTEMSAFTCRQLWNVGTVPLCLWKYTHDGVTSSGRPDHKFTLGRCAFPSVTDLPIDVTTTELRWALLL